MDRVSMRVGLGAGVPRRLQMPAQGLLIQIRARCQSELLGRVVNALGEPIDGKGPIGASLSAPVDSPSGLS